MKPVPYDRRAAPQSPVMALHPSHAAEPQPGDLMGLRSAIDSVLRHGGLALSVFCLVLLLAAAYALLAQPMYKADSLLRIDSKVKDSLAPSLSAAGERGGIELARHNVAGETEIIVSREVMLPVIASLAVDVEVGMGLRYGWLPVGSLHGITLPRFQVPASRHGKKFNLTVQGTSWTLNDHKGVQVAQGSTDVNTAFTLDGGEARIEVRAPLDTPSTKLSLKQLQPLKAHEEVMKRLRIVELKRDSGVLRLSYEDAQASRAAALLNRLVRAYLDHTVARKASDGAQALGFVEAQLPAMKANLDAAEQALASYSQANKAAPLNTESDALLRQRTDLERQALDLKVKRDQLAESLTPAHPELAAVLRQLGTVNAAMARLSSQADRLPDQNKEMVRLQREVQTQSQMYAAVLAHAQQLRVADSGWLANAQQLDRAMVPVERSRPKRLDVMSVGAGLGLVLALAAALTAHAMQPTVNGARELLSHAVPPTLAVIPESAAQKRLMAGRLPDGSLEELGTHRLLARAAPEDPSVESLRTLHMGLMLRERQIATKVILVTAPTAGTGKTFIAANLAAVMAETGRRVLLMEGDLRKPGLDRLVSIDGMAPGLSDLLAGTHSLDKVVHRHPSAGFDVMLQGSRTRRLASLPLSPRLEESLQELRQRYDHIVINGAPTSPSRDALVMGHHADLALMVVRAEQSLLGETRTALYRLQQGGVKLEGLVFNGVKRNRLNAPIVT